ncbi:MAG TPA: DegT/DnrJ/EryC1/StrS family aminotransferase [Solirubrobacteraceae bacterium]|jgi:dTDP-4-amino-4,6-dideoxygalactose transaminase
MQVAFARPFMGGGEAEALADVVASGWVSQGPRVQAFERAFAERVGAPEAIATTSCTTALHLALYAAGVTAGDEVVVPSMSFIATANSVWQCGATPVFADIDPDTYNLDVASAERAITERTKAIMPVHQLGLPADLDAFQELADRYGVILVEDAACAIGAIYKGRQIGSHGSIACFSLHPRKVITTGEGGVITLHDAALAARIRQLRQHAMDVSDLARHSAKDVVVESYPERGFNVRMTDMQAALGLCQMEVLDEILERRHNLAERYNSLLSGIPGIETPSDPPHIQRTWQSYCIRVGASFSLDRTELMRQLLADGVPTRRGVMAIHQEPAYAESATAPLPHTEAATADTLMLPLHPGLTEEEQDFVVERLTAYAMPLAA